MTGKDKTGKYHPPKGKPSGNPRHPNENLTKDKIINEAADMIRDNPDPKVLHPNRHISKSGEDKNSREDKNSSG